MSKSLEFWFDIGSPAAYLAWTQIEKIAEQHGADLAWRPMLLGGVFKATGNRPPAAVVAKGQYMLRDLGRYAALYGVPLQFNPYFPVNTLQCMRGLAARIDQENFSATLKVLFEGMWVTGKNLADAEVIAAELDAAGLDGAGFIADSQDAAIKEKLKSLTEQAVQKGIFGAPSILVGEELFFGQDRLDFVERALEE